MKIFWVSILFFPIVGFTASIWGLLDVLQRPAVQFRAAGMSRQRRARCFAAIAFSIGIIATVFGFGGTNHFFGLGLFLSGEVLGAVGITAAAWYRLSVRPWLDAQLRFAPHPD